MSIVIPVSDQSRPDRRTMRLGCGLLALLMVVGLTAATILAIRQELRAARYPGAIPMPGYTHYAVQQGVVRLDNAYRTSAPFAEVYRWYKIGFNLIPSGETGEGCLQLRKISQPFDFQRRMTVWVCETPVGQMILVSREMSFR